MEGNGDAVGANLRSATVLVPTPDEPSVPGTWELVEREVLSMLMVEDELGLSIPAFTSVAALARWQPEGGAYVEREAAWLFGLAAGDPDGRVVVDPGSPSASVLEPVEVAALAEGGDPDAAKAAQVLVATPSEPIVTEVAAAIHDAIAAEAAASSARLFRLEVGGERQDVVFVDLVAGTGDEEISAVMGRIVEGVVARTALAGGLRFMVVTGEWREAYESGGIELFRR